MESLEDDSNKYLYQIRLREKIDSNPILPEDDIETAQDRDQHPEIGRRGDKQKKSKSTQDQQQAVIHERSERTRCGKKTSIPSTQKQKLRKNAEDI